MLIPSGISGRPSSSNTSSVVTSDSLRETEICTLGWRVNALREGSPVVVADNKMLSTSNSSSEAVDLTAFGIMEERGDCQQIRAMS